MASPGQVLAGRYLIVEQLGAGGMGAVYRADDLRLSGRAVAVKEMSLAALPPSQHDWARMQFTREAQLLAGLNHPGLAAVTDFFEDSGRSFLVMDFIPGRTLESYLEQSGPLPSAQVIIWVRQLCDVLIYLHTRQPPVIFRDLKPANIMVTPEGRLKLIDFGIARLFNAGKSQDTQSLGTPGYAAPEQYGRAQTDVRSDVYSLGVVIHEMLTGYDPSTSPFGLPPPSSLVPGVDLAWDRLVAGATAPNPESRFPSIALLCAALPGTSGLTTAPTQEMWPAVVAGPGSIHAEVIPATIPLRPAAKPRPHRLRLFVLGVLLVLLAGLAVGLLLLSRNDFNSLSTGTRTPVYPTLTNRARPTVTPFPTRPPVPTPFPTPPRRGRPTRPPRPTRPRPLLDWQPAPISLSVGVDSPGHDGVG